MSNLNIAFGGKSLIASPKGLKLGTKGKVQKASEFVLALPKSDRRKVRKALRSVGRIDLIDQTIRKAA